MSVYADSFFFFFTFDQFSKSPKQCLGWQVKSRWASLSSLLFSSVTVLFWDQAICLDVTVRDRRVWVCERQTHQEWEKDKLIVLLSFIKLPVMDMSFSFSQNKTSARKNNRLSILGEHFTENKNVKLSWRNGLVLSQAGNERNVPLTENKHFIYSVYIIYKIWSALQVNIQYN